MKNTSESAQRDPIQANLLKEKKKFSIKKNRTKPEDLCPVYGDQLVAYCVDTREYIGLKVSYFPFESSSPEIRLSH